MTGKRAIIISYVSHHDADGLLCCPRVDKTWDVEGLPVYPVCIYWLKKEEKSAGCFLLALFCVFCGRFTDSTTNGDCEIPLTQVCIAMTLVHRTAFTCNLAIVQCMVILLL